MLFESGEIRRKVSDLPLVQRCAVCGIKPNPLPEDGEGESGILIVFGKPNDVQWECRSWFADTTQPVFQAITYQGGDPKREAIATGVLPCSGAGKNGKYEQCLARLLTIVTKFKPTVIITVGELATGALLRLYNPLHYKEGTTSAEFYGQCIPLNQEPGWNSWLAPVMSAERLDQYISPEVKQVAQTWLFRHIVWAYGLKNRRPPKYEKPSIEILVESDRIISALDQAQASELTAFDYETSTLEPWKKCASILTCSIAMGSRRSLERTVAFPMTSKAVIERWKEYLRSDTAKIGANIMYEHYWSIVFLNTPTVNWVWDTCLGSRILDCSQGVSGLKRTTFVNLGIIGYDDTVDPFMKSENPDGSNNLHKMKPNDLLTYNAYDSAYTYECALRQRELLRVDF